MTQCTVSSCTASYYGGGLFNFASATVRQCYFSNDRAANGGGGAIWTENVFLEVDSSTLSECRASAGGGIANKAGKVALNNSTISGCIAFTDGGGVFNGAFMEAGTVNMTCCTVCNNVSAGLGGGLRINAGAVNVRSSILGGNTASTGPDAAGTIVSMDYNLIEQTAGIIFTGTTIHNITRQSAGLLALGNNGGPTPTHAVPGNSAAVGHGDPALGPPFDLDQRGYRRKSPPDIGAYEFSGKQPATVELINLVQTYDAPRRCGDHSAAESEHASDL